MPTLFAFFYSLLTAAFDMVDDHILLDIRYCQFLVEIPALGYVCT